MKKIKDLDRVRICGFVSSKDERHCDKQKKKLDEYLQRLKRERYGNTTGHYGNIFNPANIELSIFEKEVLRKGLEFGLPQR